MRKINLRDFYPWYTTDELIDVPDKVAEELLAGKQYDAHPPTAAAPSSCGEPSGGCGGDFL